MPINIALQIAFEFIICLIIILLYLFHSNIRILLHSGTIFPAGAKCLFEIQTSSFPTVEVPIQTTKPNGLPECKFFRHTINASK